MIERVTYNPDEEKPAVQVSNDLPPVSGEITVEPEPALHLGNQEVKYYGPAETKQMAMMRLGDVETDILMIDNSQPELLLQIQTTLIATSNNQESMIKPRISVVGENKQYDLRQSLQSIKRQLHDDEYFKQQLDIMIQSVEGKLEEIDY